MRVLLPPDGFGLPSSPMETASGAPATVSSPRGTLLLAGVIVFAAILFLSTLRFEFVYDDQGQIVDNALVHSWRFVPEYFQGQVWQYLFPHAPANYYRPLNLLWFRVNHALFGLQPFGWHASAVLLHLLAVSLVFAVVRRVTAKPMTAAVAALLFAVHPTRHEVVAWVSGTTESLCAVFVLSAFWAYLKSREGRTALWMSVSCLLYAAGLLAKETALILPALVCAHTWIYGTVDAPHVVPSIGRRLRQAAGRALPYLPVAIVYLVVRISVLHGFSHGQTNVGVPAFLLTLPSVLYFYGKQWLLPIRLSEFYDLPLLTRFEATGVLVPLLSLVAAAAALWLFRRKLATPETMFALAWIGVPLLPVLNFAVFPAGELVHDRYFYLPGLGAALLVALAVQPLLHVQAGQGGPRKTLFGLPQRFVLVLLVLLFPLTYSTAKASSYWVDDATLFDHAYRVAPLNATVRNNHAIQLSRRGETGTALTLLQDLAKERPDYVLGNYNLGRILYEVNLVVPAEHHLEIARKLDPNMPDTYVQLGILSLKTGRREEAEAHFRRAVALRPHQANYYFALGVVLARGKDCSLARAEFEKALSLKPDFVQAREQMDNCGAPPSGVSSQAPPPEAVPGRAAPQPPRKRPLPQPASSR